jgi:hypothetical protein
MCVRQVRKSDVHPSRNTPDLSGEGVEQHRTVIRVWMPKGQDHPGLAVLEGAERFHQVLSA